MPDTTDAATDTPTDALIRDLLEWLAAEPRTYAQVMDAGRTSCPRLTVWEDATDRGFVARQHQEGGTTMVYVTSSGRDFLGHAPRTRVRRAHRRSFEIAPAVKAGDVVQVDHTDERNPAWFRGRTRDGVDGYFPHAWFTVDHATVGAAASATAKRDYDAMELTVSEGDVVEPIEATPGWVLVRSSAGDVGWIPAASLEHRS